MGNNKKSVIDCFVSVATTLDAVDDATKKFLTKTLTLLKGHYTNYELIIVANGLPDDAVESVAELLKEHPCIRIIRLSRHYNQEVATFAAIESAIGDYVIVTSAVNDPPAAVKELVAILRERNDIVFGVSKTPLPYPFLAKLGRRWFFWYSGHFLEVNIPLNTTYLMGMNRRAINALTQIKGHHRHIRHISAQVGFKTATYEYKPKFDTGFAKRGFIKSVNLALPAPPAAHEQNKSTSQRCQPAYRYLYSAHLLRAQWSRSRRLDNVIAGDLDHVFLCLSDAGRAGRIHRPNPRGNARPTVLSHYGRAYE